MSIKKVVIWAVGIVGGFIGGVIFTLNGLLQIDEVVQGFKSWIHRLLFGRNLEQESRNYGVRYKPYYSKYILPKIHFSTREKGEGVLSEMERFIKDYGEVTVEEYLHICGSKFSPHYADCSHGWTDLKGAKIVRVGYQAFAIDLPEPIRL